MKKIPLTQGQFALVDDDDYDYLMQWKWYAHYSHGTKSFYVRRHGRKSEYDTSRPTMHMARVIMNAQKGEYVDHRDHNTLDNQRSNLRVCTNSQNSMNRGPTKSNTSGYKGVVWDKSTNKWHARIQVNERVHHLGLFTSKHDAGRAYNLASMMYHGEFAYTNKIKEK